MRGRQLCESDLVENSDAPAVTSDKVTARDVGEHLHQFSVRTDRCSNLLLRERHISARADDLDLMIARRAAWGTRALWTPYLNQPRDYSNRWTCQLRRPDLSPTDDSDYRNLKGEWRRECLCPRQECDDVSGHDGKEVVADLRYGIVEASGDAT